MIKLAAIILAEPSDIAIRLPTKLPVIVSILELRTAYSLPIKLPDTLPLTLTPCNAVLLPIKSPFILLVSTQ